MRLEKFLSVIRENGLCCTTSASVEFLRGAGLNSRDTKDRRQRCGRLRGSAGQIVLRGLARWVVFNDNAALVTHQATKFVLANSGPWSTRMRYRHPSAEQSLVHDARNSRCRQGDIDFVLHRPAAVVADNIEGSETAHAHQSVAHEIRGLGLIRPDRLDQFLRRFRFVSALESTASFKTYVAVHAPDALVTPGIGHLAE